jgi:hypothetical protein
MDIDLKNQFILKALDYYDNQRFEYYEYLKYEITLINADNILFIIKDEKIYKDYEILGCFDNQTNIWTWGWILNMKLELITICNDLLQYAIKLEPINSDDYFHYFLKTLLINSNIKIDEFIQLDVYLAICSYIIKKNILFIYPYKKYIDKDKKKYITYYYLIK